MHFTTIIFILLATATGTLAGVQCKINDFSPTINKEALHTCLDYYRTQNWGGMECGGASWFKDTKRYKSPTDCYNACASCISTAIDAGAIDVRCDDQEGSVDCWMGYH
ncbi:hypothetical protein JAAARDRAFT_132302 [Jaapia argillacea MUCL 33604]|uniref:Uncharacterized protein n=1 Tax=Jaapia argillacea MUCL 33604 TaxID=933084 RepID=A0A067PRX7_9AGAM|nr:hypothetical protein JAAARDRAFT_132302 [Jaapia argillacea MUCL 33604]